MNRIEKISDKQALLLYWWHPNSPFHRFYGIMGWGAIRTGKSVFGSRGACLYAEWYVTTIKDCNHFAVIGQTVETARENIILPLEQWLESRGAKVRHNWTSKTLSWKFRGETIVFKYFGADNKKSYTKILGQTYFGILFDEMWTQDKKMKEEAVGRTATFKHGKIFGFFNPEGSENDTFYQQYVVGCSNYKYLNVHFEVKDNPQFEDEETYNRLASQYTGLYYKRKILGLPVRAEGRIYEPYKEDKHVVDRKTDPRFTQAKFKYGKIVVGIDTGATKSSTDYQAWAFNQDYTLVLGLSEYNHRNVDNEGKTLPDHLRKDEKQYANDFFEWVTPIKQEFPSLKTIYVEASDPMFRLMLQRHPRNKMMKLNFIAGWKYPIIQRIKITRYLQSNGMWYIDRSMVQLRKSMEDAVWDENASEDTRLDDGTYLVDPLDSMEYAIIPGALKMIKNVSEVIN